MHNYDLIELESIILEKIEQLESKLLVWGLVDYFIKSDDLENIVDDVLDEFLANGLMTFFVR